MPKHSDHFICLVINAGSSSVKFSVFDVVQDEVLFSDSLERISSVADAVKHVPDSLERAGFRQFDAIGHRVAHGGERFKNAALINKEVVEAIESCIPLAPLHNPPILEGIKMTLQQWPECPQVAVFDTAFHQTMPDYAVTYAIPKAWRSHGIRRYGFHGTSHKYVMEHVAEALQRKPDELKIISCHLGNGASVCAIQQGKSVDTSMGMTALEGLVMGTRSGDVDPGLFLFLQHEMGLSMAEIEQALYKDSGLKALFGSNDMRDIEQAVQAGDKQAHLAIDVYTYRVRKYIGAYAASMGGCDVLVFTGGIGEHSARIRQKICENFEYMGLHFNVQANQKLTWEGFEVHQLQQDTSRVTVAVTRTREQWMIAKEAFAIAYKEINDGRANHN